MHTHTPELFLDVRKLNVPDLAAILVEERKGGNQERIKPYKTWIGLDGSTPFPVGTETELKQKEMDGVRAVQTLARKGAKTIVWVSPPGGMSQYSESRIIVYEVESIEETKVNFKCVAICSQHNPHECLDIVNRILNEGGECLGEPIVPDDLRSEPVGLGVGVENWVEYLANVVSDIPEVWEAVKSGVHEANAREAWLMADVIVRQFKARAAKVTTQLEAIALGVAMEREIRARFDISLMAGGVHGMSNESAMGAFDAFYSGRDRDGRLQRCGRCGNYYIKSKERCPDCKV